MYDAFGVQMTDTSCSAQRNVTQIARFSDSNHHDSEFKTIRYYNLTEVVAAFLCSHESSEPNAKTIVKWSEQYNNTRNEKREYQRIQWRSKAVIDKHHTMSPHSIFIVYYNKLFHFSTTILTWWGRNCDILTYWKKQQALN